MSLVDLFVLQDDAQYTRNSWRQRMKIRTREGWRWLTVPVLTRGRHPQRIADVVIDDSKAWQRKHLNVLDNAYAKSQFWPEHRDRLAGIITSRTSKLSEIGVASIQYLAAELGINTRIVCSSALGLEDNFATGHSGKSARSVKLAQFIRSLGGTHFLEGSSGRNLMDPAAFEDAGVNLVFHDFRHPAYSQNWSSFEPYMSALDCLLCHGPDSSQILSAGMRGFGRSQFDV